LSQIDSSMATGWLRKSNFADKVDEAVQLTTACKLARILIDTKSCLFSQWFPGESNIVSDSLSRDFHLPVDYLSNILSIRVPEQAPFGLTIWPLPIEIDSWLTSLLCNQPQGMRWSKEQQPSKFALGIDTSNTSPQLGYSTIDTWKTSQEEEGIRYSAPSLSLLEKVDLVLEILNKSRQTQLELPWMVWHMPTRWLTGQTQDLMKMESLHSFYNASLGDIQ